MTVIYHLPAVLITSCIGWLLLLAILFVVLKRLGRSVISPVAMLLTGIFVCAISLGSLGLISQFSNAVLREAQTQIAKPYIEASLEQASCGVVSEGSVFYAESKLKWQSVDERAECFYNNVDWVCTCSP